MKLLMEYTSMEDLQVLTEDTEDSKKVYKIKGPFLQSEIKNRNGRIYSKTILEREVGKFQDKIKSKRALGELDHPPSPTVNLDRVSHLIEDLKMEDKNGVGIAKLLDTPKGAIAQTLVKEGILLGVSTRGVGTLKGDKVNEDYKLITIDIVADPSAPNAFVDGILENKEFIITEGGQIVEKAVEKLEDHIKKYGSKEIREAMSEFLNNIRKDF